MTIETMDLFADALTEVANGPRVGGFAGTTEALMRRLAEKGATLAHLSTKPMMNRSVRTLEAHAREFGIAFPDYVPMALRKRVVFLQRGDFFELRSEHVPAVAAILDIVVAGEGDERMCAFPVHAEDECRQALEGNWFVVKLVRAKKPGKAADNG